MWGEEHPQLSGQVRGRRRTMQALAVSRRGIHCVSKCRVKSGHHPDDLSAGVYRQFSLLSF